MRLTRPLAAKINLSHLQHNYLQAKQLSPHQVYAVIKADAYGHGALPIAQALTQADGFCVACVDEAIYLRKAHIQQPIMVLEGALCATDWQLAQSHQLQMVIHHQQQLSMLKQAALNTDRAISVSLKVNTGMNRVGIKPHQVATMIAQIKRTRLLKLDYLMTHHSASDEQDLSVAQLQLQQFAPLTDGLAASTANSAAILAGLNKEDAISRAGIMLYGSSPFAFKSAQSLNLKAVMSVHSKVISLQTIGCGEKVGYGGRFMASCPTKIAVIAMGYGDGYPRHAVDGTPVLINGQRCPLAGRVSMDMLTVDVSACAHVDIGTPVELWGETLAIDEVAQHSQTISYELFCRLTARVPRLYS